MSFGTTVELGFSPVFVCYPLDLGIVSNFEGLPFHREDVAQSGGYPGLLGISGTRPECNDGKKLDVNRLPLPLTRRKAWG